MLDRNKIIWAVLFILLIIFFKTYCSARSLSCGEPLPSWPMAITLSFILVSVAYSIEKLKNLIVHPNKSMGANVYVILVFMWSILILLGLVLIFYLYILNRYLF